MKTILLYFGADLHAAHVARVQEAAPDARVIHTRDRDEIEAALDEIEIAVGSFPYDLLPGARSLRWIQQWAAGADWLLRYPEAVEMDFVLTSTSGMHAIQMSEHVFAFLLAFARGLPRAWRDQEQCVWKWRRNEDVFELAGRTLLLVGVGAIGERTAAVARALGMGVLGVRRNPAVDAPGVEAMVGPDRLLEVLPRADFRRVGPPDPRDAGYDR